VQAFANAQKPTSFAVPAAQQARPILDGIRQLMARLKALDE
jgi:hypothetical protein